MTDIFESMVQSIAVPLDGTLRNSYLGKSCGGKVVRAKSSRKPVGLITDKFTCILLNLILTLVYMGVTPQAVFLLQFKNDWR